MKSARFTADLGNPILLKLLKAEANEQNTSIREVLITVLESYFAHRLESKALQKASESVFSEWQNKKDSDYDKL